MLNHLAAEVLLIYAELDAQVAAFAAASGLRCPQGCGECCSSEKVEATVLEMLPLAFALFADGQAELLIQRLEKVNGRGECLLHRPDLAGPGAWSCTCYSHRAVVCRLFGFAGNLDRAGAPRLALCRVIRQADLSGEPPLSLEEEVLALMPLFSEAGMRITALHPGLGTIRLPINSALLEALLKVGITRELEAGQQLGSDELPSEPPDEPPFAAPPLPKAA
jgi:Fe-S-cluster containining protein